MKDANNLQLFTVRDAAKLLDMSEHTIRRLIRRSSNNFAISPSDKPPHPI